MKNEMNEVAEVVVPKFLRNKGELETYNMLRQNGDSHSAAMETIIGERLMAAMIRG